MIDLAELFAGLIGLVAVAGVVALAILGRPVSGTLMLVVGAAIGAFYTQKASGSTADAVRRALQK